MICVIAYNESGEPSRKVNGFFFAPDVAAAQEAARRSGDLWLHNVLSLHHNAPHNSSCFLGTDPRGDDIYLLVD